MNRIRFFPIFLFAAVLLGLSPLASARPSAELRLSPLLTREIEQILKAGDSLHHSLYTQNEEQTDIGIRDVLQQIGRARQFAGLAKPHERAHLMRVLDAAYDQFELTQSAFGEERRKRLEDGYNQLVNLVRVYHLDRSYAIYFCPKDRTTWVQTGTHAQNPFHHEASREPCGIRVPK